MKPLAARPLLAQLPNVEIHIQKRYEGVSYSRASILIARIVEWVPCSEDGSEFKPVYGKSLLWPNEVHSLDKAVRLCKRYLAGAAEKIKFVYDGKIWEEKL